MEGEKEESSGPDSQLSKNSGAPPAPEYAHIQPPSKKSSNPKIAGILLIIAGAVAIITGVFMVALGMLLPGMMGTIPPEYYNYSNVEITTALIQNIYLICGAIIIVLAIFTLLGGIMALKKKMWGLALTGSILGLFTIGVFFISSLLSLIALILLVLSKGEFERSSI